jgi:hypothetical protein
MLYVNNLRLCPTAPLRHLVPVAICEDDDEYGHERISAFKICNVLGRGRKYMLFNTLFKDEQTPHLWYRLNETHFKVALQHLLDSPDFL